MESLKVATKKISIGCLVFACNVIALSRPGAITKKLKPGEYSCLVHYCMIPGDLTQYVQEFSTECFFGKQ